MVLAQGQRVQNEAFQMWTLRKGRGQLTPTLVGCADAFDVGRHRSLRAKVCSSWKLGFGCLRPRKINIFMEKVDLDLDRSVLVQGKASKEGSTVVLRLMIYVCFFYTVF